MYRITAATEASKRRSWTVSDDSGVMDVGSFHSKSKMDVSAKEDTEKNAHWNGETTNFVEGVSTDENVVANTQQLLLG